MRLLRSLAFTAGAFLLLFSLNAQKKYALIVGIDDYYEVKGIKSKESLNGSVNDANSIKNLLSSRFGFKAADIDTIYNAAATRDNIIKGLEKKLNQCKAGDVMVFYYSGHGVWMKNSEEEADPIKRGMNQAMLTSDLYNFNDKFKCFLRDFTLKKYFNLFIDKKVTLTAMFDCCFSGNLAMTSRTDQAIPTRTRSMDFNELMARLTETVPNPVKLIDSIAGNSSASVQTITDPKAVITDTLDSDGDGVPDYKDKQKYTDPECFPVNEEGLGNCPFNYTLNKTLNKYDSIELRKNTAANLSSAQERSFNARAVLSISEKDTIARPALRKKSKFLFMSGTTDYQKALEFADEHHVTHGLFTASLVRILTKNPVDTPVDTLFQNIVQDMDSYHLDQKPTIYSDPVRRENPLFSTRLLSK